MKKISAGLCLVVAIILVTTAVQAETEDFDRRITVDDMQFKWRVDDTLIHVGLSAPTTGWVGIGFNPSKEMKDANFIIGYVKKGTVKITDHFGTTNRQHTKDTKIGGKRDVTNVSGQETDGITEIGFTIPLNSGDPKDKALSLSKETTVLLAYGSGRDSFRSKHKFKATVLVNLATGEYRNVD